jgi:hypothetical protein
MHCADPSHTVGAGEGPVIVATGEETYTVVEVVKELPLMSVTVKVTTKFPVIAKM